MRIKNVALIDSRGNDLHQNNLSNRVLTAPSFDADIDKAVKSGKVQTEI
jgi:hypothetical protein